MPERSLAFISPDTRVKFPTSTSRRCARRSSSLGRHRTRHKSSLRDSTTRSSGLSRPPPLIHALTGVTGPTSYPSTRYAYHLVEQFGVYTWTQLASTTTATRSTLHSSPLWRRSTTVRIPHWLTRVPSQSRCILILSDASRCDIRPGRIHDDV